MIAAIVDGRYTMKSQGGLPVGKYRVRIEAARERLGDNDAAGAAGIALPRRGEQYIPAKYNKNTELNVTIEPNRRAITHDFTLVD